MPDEEEDVGHHMHGGPYRGEWIPTATLGRSILDMGFWTLLIGHFRGRYVRDQGSAGGRDWDWVED